MVCFLLHNGSYAIISDNKEETPYKCECGKEFSRKDHLRQHQVRCPLKDRWEVGIDRRILEGIGEMVVMFADKVKGGSCYAQEPIRGVFGGLPED